MSPMPSSPQRPPQRRTPRVEVPTAIQLDVRPTVMLLRGLGHRCPACSGRHVFRHWFRIQQRCPTTMAIDNFGRAAKIQVYARTTHGRQTGRIISQTGWIRAQ